MLVTLEGLDGSGKTTVWEGLQDRYPEATFTREPTDDSWYGEAVYRSIADGDADPLAELFLHRRPRRSPSRVVEPALERGDLVISDRYSDSRFAYQGATLEAWSDDAGERALEDPSSTSSMSTNRSRSYRS